MHHPDHVRVRFEHATKLQANHTISHHKYHQANSLAKPDHDFACSHAHSQATHHIVGRGILRWEDHHNSQPQCSRGWCRCVGPSL